MTHSFTGRKRIRKSFGHIPEVTMMPNLIEVQRTSYENFLQMNLRPAQRDLVGLQEVFKSVFPIRDFAERAALDFVQYELEEPKYDVEECHQRGMTYAAPLRVTLRLIVWDVDDDTGSKSVRDIKEQDVYMGDLPLMTDNGTFVINGTERVIVSQMHRSPGVFYDHDKGKTHSSGKFLFSARIIPYRGSWLDFEFDAKDLIHVRIDRRRKLPATTLLLALGLSQEEILGYFYGAVVFTRAGQGWKQPFRPERLRGQKLTADLINAESGDVLAEAGTKLTPRLIKRLAEQGLEQLYVSAEELVGRYVAVDLIDEQSGLVYAEAGDELTPELLARLIEARSQELPVLDIDHVTVGPYMRNTLAAERCHNREEALLDIYRVLRPGEPPNLDTAENLFHGLFFDSERYDLSPVGRVKMNARLGLDTDDTVRVLRSEDILAVIKHLIEIKDGRGEIDDIDHLGNRRVRSVGELMENQFRVGLLRMERAVRERMSSVEIDAAMPHDLINAKPVAAAVREFFGSSQLSQFMDQTNPLSEITHKRRLSALGPGGLTRERAGFEVRDVHPTHYGRICPIETPEGPNIGLINSLATYARINKYGFIESPYRRVVDGRVSDEVVYLSAMEEGRYTIAQANAELSEDRRFALDLVSCRQNGDFVLARPDTIEFIDVSPKQLVSVAAALIPFLENDDANRALMGSNMQRQAVPLIQSEAPLVGTGMEAVVARDSGAAVVARRGGVVDQVDASRIVIRITAETERADSVVDIYNLRKFQRSNQNTCINQRPVVKVGDRVAAGDIVADGPSTNLGELALGRNVLVAFMPWNGYNFEDSILISERIVRDDVFTSIHIEEFEVMARDTKLGPEFDHPRHPERRRGVPAQPRRGRDRLHRRRGPGRRHPGRQGHAQGRDPDDPGREAAARDLRREGGRRPRHLAQGAARRDRHGGRGAGVLAPRHRQGRARDGDRARRDRAPGQGPRRRARDPRAQRLRPPARAARGPDAEQRAQGDRAQPAADRRGAGRAGRAASGGRSASTTPSAWSRSSSSSASSTTASSACRSASTTRSRSCSAATSCRPACSRWSRCSSR